MNIENRILKKAHLRHTFPSIVCLFLVSTLLSIPVNAQQEFAVNMAFLDGVDITPDNILSYTVESPKATQVRIKGTIRYKNSGMYLSYSFTTNLLSGVNSINSASLNPQWDFSSASLRSLFTTYKVLPEGTFEYCVSVIPVNSSAESSNNIFDECLYHREDGIFSINLLEPDDKARLREYYPALSWVANYTFSSELKYRLRIAEIKQGQNPINAVMRNQPVYDERNLLQNSIVYPVYARPLEKNKPYAWTVDAYFNEILIGGAETWQFIIVDDTAVKTLPANRSYVDIKRENGKTRLVFAGRMKLKYLLENAPKDVLTLSLINENGKQMRLTTGELKAKYGDNRYILDLKEASNLKHNQQYTLKIQSGTGSTFSIPFTYLNPDFQ